MGSRKRFSRSFRPAFPISIRVRSCGIFGWSIPTIASRSISNVASNSSLRSSQAPKTHPRIFFGDLTTQLERRAHQAVLDRQSPQLSPQARRTVSRRRFHAIAGNWPAAKTTPWLSHAAKGRQWVIAVVPRWLARASYQHDSATGARFWDKTAIQLPAGAPARWHNILTGEQIYDRRHEQAFARPDIRAARFPGRPVIQRRPESDSKSETRSREIIAERPAR